MAPLPLDSTLAAFKEASEESIKKSTAWIKLRLSKCPQCDAHHIATELQFIAANGKQGQATLPALDKTKGPARESNTIAPVETPPASPNP